MWDKFGITFPNFTNATREYNLTWLTSSPMLNILPNFNIELDVLDSQTSLLLIHGKLEILKEIAIAKKELPKFYRTWNFLL